MDGRKEGRNGIGRYVSWDGKNGIG